VCVFVRVHVLQLEHGTHVNAPYVEYYKVSELIWEPNGSSGIICIDGELSAAGIVHCNILQHTATHCNTLQQPVTHCHMLQHTTTHCNTLEESYNLSELMWELNGSS